MLTPEILAMVLRELPSVIMDVEALFGKGNGANKRAAALVDLGGRVYAETAAASTGGQRKSLVKYAPEVGMLIDSTVSIMNKSGLLGKSEDTTAIENLKSSGD